MKLNVAIAVLIVLIGALGTVWFFRNFERVTVDVPADFEGEARFNDFLAAEMLLESFDIEADSRDSLSPTRWLPELTDTLFVRASPAIADPAAHSLLTQWVSNGGHLILLPPTERTRIADEFLQSFGFRLRQIDPAADDGAGADDAEVAGDGDEPPQRHLVTDELRFDSRYGYGYTVARSEPTFSIDATDRDFTFDSVRDRDGQFVVRRLFGSGYVTLIADASIFGNLALADFDHARLLLDAVAGAVSPGKVWFIYDVHFPPLWQLIWQNARYFVLGVALLIALWLWAVIPRFGPLVSPAAPTRRSILEHIAAAGRFNLRYDGAESLMGSAVDALIHRAETRFPGIGRLPAGEQAARISHLARMPQARVAKALAETGQLGPREFTQKIRRLQAIRNSI